MEINKSEKKKNTSDLQILKQKLQKFPIIQFPFRKFANGKYQILHTNK